MPKSLRVNSSLMQLAYSIAPRTTGAVVLLFKRSVPQTTLTLVQSCTCMLLEHPQKHMWVHAKAYFWCPDFFFYFFFAITINECFISIRIHSGIKMNVLFWGPIRFLDLERVNMWEYEHIWLVVTFGWQHFEGLDYGSVNQSFWYYFAWVKHMKSGTKLGVWAHAV